MPVVSVVLPTHNRSNLLPRAISSVLAQTFDDLELIVVDDASTEDIGALVASFGDSRLRYVRRDQCGGPAGARNSGVAVATGEFVAFQDSDDEWLLDKLEKQLEVLRADPSLDLLSCGMVRQDASHDFVFPTSELLSAGLKDAMCEHLISFTQTWLVKRKVLEKVGEFDESLRVWDDWELLYRISRRHNCAYLQECLVISHVTPGSVGSDIDRRINDLNCFVSKYPDSEDGIKQARLLYLLGRFELLQGMGQQARRHLTLALRSQPLQLKAWVALLLAFAPMLLVRRALLKNDGS